LNTFKPNVSFVFSCEYRDLRRGTRRGCKFGQEGSLSSAEYYLADSAGDSFSPAVNPRIKELIPFGQPKGCERFRVRIISRPGRREGERGERGGETGQKGKESVTGRKNRREDEGRGPGMTSRKAREANRERERERERERKREIAREGGRVRERQDAFRRSFRW